MKSSHWIANITCLLMNSEKDHVNASATIEEANNEADQRYQLVNEDGET